MDITANIKALRNANHIPQAEIARRLNIDPSSYHRLENRGSKLSVEQVEEIATALGVSLLDLITYGHEAPMSSERVGELEKENQELKDRIIDLEERVELYKDRDTMRKEALKHNYQKIQDTIKNSQSLDSLSPEVLALKQMIDFIVSLSGIKTSNDQL